MNDKRGKGDTMGRMDTATVGPDLELDFNIAMAHHIAPGIAQMVQSFGTVAVMRPGTVIMDAPGVRLRAREAVDALDASAGVDDGAYLAAAIKLAAAGCLLVYMRVRRR